MGVASLLHQQPLPDEPSQGPTQSVPTVVVAGQCVSPKACVGVSFSCPLQICLQYLGFEDIRERVDFS